MWTEYSGRSPDPNTAAGHTTAMRDDIDYVRAGLDAQVAYLDSFIRPNRNA